MNSVVRQLALLVGGIGNNLGNHEKRVGITNIKQLHAESVLRGQTKRLSSKSNHTGKKGNNKVISPESVIPLGDDDFSDF